LGENISDEGLAMTGKGGLIKNTVMIFSMMAALFLGSSAGNSSNAQDEGLVSRYENELDKLSENDIDTILIAKDRFIKLFRGKDKLADEGFRLFLNYFERAIKSQPSIQVGGPLWSLLTAMANETTRSQTGMPGISLKTTDYIEAFNSVKNLEAEEIKNKFAAEYRLVQKYRACGINFQTGEGMWEFKKDYRFLLLNVLRDFTIPIKEYVRFMAEEDGIRLAEDAGWLVPRDDIRKAIARREQFIRTNSSLAETTEISLNVANLILCYLTGMDNSPAYDKEFRLLPELQESYARFVTENRDSSFYFLVEGFYQRLKKHDFHLLNEECVSFLESQAGIIPHLKWWARSLRERMKFR
jgi:hypothetical protein